MLDDPLSAVDAHVSKYLFNSCICDKLKDKTRVLVTHQLQYVSACDQILYLENGCITESGTYTQLMADKKNFFKLMSTYVGEEDQESSESDVSDSEPAEQESKVDGDASASAPLKNQLRSRKSSAKEKSIVKRKSSIEIEATEEEKAKAQEARRIAEQLMQSEERTKGGVPKETYFFYVRYCGGWHLLALTALFLAVQTTAQTWSTWWLNLWSDKEYDESTAWYLGIYAGITISQVVFTLFSTLITAYMGIVSAYKLHNLSFESVLRAPMAFFDTTPIGRIINRFSKGQKKTRDARQHTRTRVCRSERLCIPYLRSPLIVCTFPFLLSSSSV